MSRARLMFDLVQRRGRRAVRRQSAPSLADTAGDFLVRFFHPSPPPRACGGDNQTNQVTRRTSNIGDGERMTSFVAVKDDLLNAGAEWVDEPVVNCRNMITSRTPDDLTPFCLAIIDAVAAAGS